jgi:hypothetical protein
MVMEKHSVDDESLRLGLIDEEAKLMVKMSGFMGSLEKTAEEENEMRRAERRLLHVRDKIRQLDESQIVDG